MRDAAHTIVTFMQSKVDYNLIFSPLPILDSAILAFPDLFVNLREYFYLLGFHPFFSNPDLRLISPALTHLEL